MFDIKENLKELPDKPGVYMHKDKLGQVIYVGKASSLKNRVRQYFQSSRNMDAKVRAMVSHIEEFEYITTATEMEALILECTLIKKYMPKYNVLLLSLIHISEPTRRTPISYAVFCLKKKKTK